MFVPHKHYLVLLGNFYGCSHKQTKSIAVIFFFFLTRAALLKRKKKREKMYPEHHPANKKEEHIFTSYRVKLLRRRF